MTYYQYTILVNGRRKKDTEDFKNLRWAVWQIVRHNPFLKTPPVSPEKLIQLEGEGLTDERIALMADALRKAQQKYKDG